MTGFYFLKFRLNNNEITSIFFHLFQNQGLFSIKYKTENYNFTMNKISNKSLLNELFEKKMFLRQED